MLAKELATRMLKQTAQRGRRGFRPEQLVPGRDVEASERRRTKLADCFSIRSVEESSDHPMPIIDDVDQQPGEIHLGKLRGDFVFRECRQQGIVKIAP